MTATWLSFDIEATGPIPGLHSMLSLGIEAFADDDEFTPLGTFEVNIRELDYCVWDSDTHAWWHDAQLTAALDITTSNPKEPRDAMERMMAFLEELPRGPHIWAAYPATFDMPFVRYYAQRFVSKDWTGFYGDPMERIACFDMASYAMQLMQVGYHDVSKKRMPKSWTDYQNPCPHVALNDAKEQGHLLREMLRAGRAGPREGVLHHPAVR